MRGATARKASEKRSISPTWSSQPLGLGERRELLGGGHGLGEGFLDQHVNAGVR